MAEDKLSTASRLVHWTFYSVSFSFVPLLAGFILTSFKRKPLEPVTLCSEYLFFSLTMCATSVGELRHISKPLKDAFFVGLNGMLILVGFVLATVYGFLLYSNSLTPPDVEFQRGLVGFSKLAAICVSVLGLFAQLNLAGVDRKETTT